MQMSLCAKSGQLFPIYHSVLPRFSMSLFKQLAHRISLSFLFTSILQDAASGGDMCDRTARKKEK